MPWWGVLILIAVAAVIAIIVTWLIVRRSTLGLAAERDAAAAREKTATEQFEAEKATREKLAAVSREQAKQLREIDAWYRQAKDDLTEATRDEYERLASDPGALDRKLDELLGTDPNDFEPTKPGTPG